MVSNNPGIIRFFPHVRKPSLHWSAIRSQIESVEARVQVSIGTKRLRIIGGYFGLGGPLEQLDEVGMSCYIIANHIWGESGEEGKILRSIQRGDFLGVQA